MPTRVHQMTATLAAGDAVSNDIFEIDRRLKSWGFETRIYAENIERGMARFCHSDAEYEPYVDQTQDLLVFHYSIYAANLELYKRSRNRKLVIYHNITPGEYFEPYDSSLAALCHMGRESLEQLNGCALALADSDYNRQELIAAGMPGERTAVRPLFMRLDLLERSTRNEPLYQEIKRRGGANLLYVGRLAPNKGCEDLIKILAYYHKYVNPRAHLWLVGSQSLTAYVAVLRMFASRLGVSDAVTFAGPVIDLASLRTYYEACDVFVFASRHEGLGVPLVESMDFGLPILAYKAAAVPETLGDSGIMYTRWSYSHICEMLHLLVTDQALRQQVIRRQRQRRADFAPEHVESALRQALQRIGAL
jgi:L-malate glycosyltransferase